MLSNISLAFMSLINLFFIPVIGLRIYCKRNLISWKMHLEILYHYILITVLNIPLTHILVNMAEAIITDTIYVETTKYTIIALISCVILSFALEVIRTFFKINVCISPRKKLGGTENEG